MKTIFMPLCAALLIFSTGCKSSEVATEVMEPEVVTEVSIEDTILEEHIAAKGGSEVLAGITSMKMTGQVEMPAMDMTLLMTMFQKAPNKLRMEVDIPQMGATILNGYDGEIAWESNPMAGGPSKLGGDRARAFAEQADMDGFLVGAAESGYTVEYIGDEEVRGAMNHKIKVMREDSSEVLLFLDAESKLETKIEAEAPNPMTGAMTTVETFMSDYRVVGGMKVPYRMEVVIGGEPFQTLTFSDIRTNVPINDSVFAYPGE